jgi:methanogenic corrinoid protein MtbC1
MTQQNQIKAYIARNKDAIATRVVDMQYSQAPDYWQQFGEEGKQKSIRDVGYHLSFLNEALVMDDREIFTDYVEWVKMLFEKINLPRDTMTYTLKCIKAALEDFLPADLNEIASQYIDAGINRMKEPVQQIRSYIDPEAHLGKLAKAFNEALLRGDKGKSSKMILDEVKKGTSIKDIYLHVFQVSQLEVGRLWLLNKINVAKEHYVSAATQMIMSQLYPYIFSTRRKGLTFLGACVGGELHEIGIRMVSDFFEMEGWDTYYLGANTPATNILHAINEYQADVLGLSIAMPFHQSALREVIEKIRQDQDNSKLKILVGGNGVDGKQSRWQLLGADGYAHDAEKAVEVANQLILTA